MRRFTLVRRELDAAHETIDNLGDEIADLRSMLRHAQERSLRYIGERDRAYIDAAGARRERDRAMDAARAEVARGVELGKLVLASERGEHVESDEAKAILRRVNGEVA